MGLLKPGVESNLLPFHLRGENSQTGAVVEDIIEDLFPLVSDSSNAPTPPARETQEKERTLLTINNYNNEDLIVSSGRILK